MGTGMEKTAFYLQEQKYRKLKNAGGCGKNYEKELFWENYYKISINKTPYVYKIFILKREKGIFYKEAIEEIRKEWLVPYCLKKTRKKQCKSRTFSVPFVFFSFLFPFHFHPFLVSFFRPALFCALLLRRRLIVNKRVSVISQGGCVKNTRRNNKQSNRKCKVFRCFFFSSYFFPLGFYVFVSLGVRKNSCRSF